MKKKIAGLVVIALFLVASPQIESQEQQEGTSPARILEVLKEINAMESLEDKAVAIEQYVAILEVLLEKGRSEGTDSDEPVNSVRTGSSEGGFRDVPWGATQAEVLESETDPDQVTDEAIYYTREVAGMEAMAAFRFLDNALVEGSYIFTDKHRNPQDHVRDYHKIVSVLTDIYGVPEQTMRRVEWPYDEEDESEWGRALQADRAHFATRWLTDDTEITALMYSNNGIWVALSYSWLDASEEVEGRKADIMKEGL